mmetsp:Transcript_12825/g.36588  ORF Transcript_12825/g.36588 Transcript_12825/m.36588 type:complete len:337 (-) Transcript_12825:3716-4726(-)
MGSTWMLFVLPPRRPLGVWTFLTRHPHKARTEGRGALSMISTHITMMRALPTTIELVNKSRKVRGVVLVLEVMTRTQKGLQSIALQRVKLITMSVTYLLVASSLPLCATMIRMSLRPREGLLMTAAGNAEVIRVEPPVESIQAIRHQEGSSLMISRRGDSDQFIRTTLRPTGEMTKRQLGRRVFSPMGTDSTVESVKAEVLLPRPLGGLVVLASVPLPVLPLEEAREKKSGMSQLSVPILFALISWTTTMMTTRVSWRSIKLNTRSVDRPCQLAMFTAERAMTEVRATAMAATLIAVIMMLEAALKGIPQIIGLTKIPLVWCTQAAMIDRLIPQVE